MGLDVSHLQLTLTPDENSRYFDIDDWNSDCNVPLENYSKYITTIEILDFKECIIVVKNEKDFEDFDKAAKRDSIENLKVFIGELNDSMRAQLSRYIADQKLEKLKSVELYCEDDGLKYYTISYGEPVQIQGMYYIGDIGYQRRGMNSLFYDTFNKYLLWGKKEDFELAYTCVAGEWYFEHRGKKAVN